MALEAIISRCNRVGLALGLAILALGLGLWLGISSEQPPAPPFEPQSATLVPDPRPLQPFELPDTRGGSFSPQTLDGRWSLLSFGYTHCPDVCPTTLAIMDNVDQKLLGTPVDGALEMVFVSVDPERDSLDQIREYLAFFNPRFRGATGDHEALHRLTDQIGVLYAKADQVDTALGYLLDHSAHLVLLDPEARLRALFGAPHVPDQIAADIEGILAKYPAPGQ
jgi:protein SCO1/2